MRPDVVGRSCCEAFVMFYIDRVMVHPHLLLARRFGSYLAIPRPKSHGPSGLELSGGGGGQRVSRPRSRGAARLEQALHLAAQLLAAITCYPTVPGQVGAWGLVDCASYPSGPRPCSLVGSSGAAARVLARAAAPAVVAVRMRRVGVRRCRGRVAAAALPVLAVGLVCRKPLDDAVAG